jgi:hypothetical protein
MIASFPRERIVRETAQAGRGCSVADPAAGGQ